MAATAGENEALSQLLARLRPRLHRYCARMVGSAIDGEDVVQDALAKATEAFPGAGPIAQPEAWLFRIAHNAALDALRRRKRQAALRADANADHVADESAAADSRVAAAASLESFLRLPAAQRSAVVLVDVLGHSLEEVASILSVTLASVKAALNRARTRLRAIAAEEGFEGRRLDANERERLRAYADRFNARDFDALRALLAEDVQLDLANRRRLAGRKDVSLYFTNYAAVQGWRIGLCLAEGRPALLMNDPNAEAKDYVVLIDWVEGGIARIRDYRFAPYVMESLIVGPLS